MSSRRTFLGSTSLPAAATALALLLALPAHAQDAAKPGETGTASAAPKPASAKDANADATGNVRKDAKNQTGISPYQSSIAKGRKAAKAKDHKGASAAFQEAIKQEPDTMYGYLLLAQSQLQQGNEDQALSTVEEGRKKKGEVAVVGKMHHLRAELLERKRNRQGSSTTLKGALLDGWKKAMDGWNTLRLFLEAHSQLPDYKEVASARAKAVKDRMDREAKYKQVVSRMANKK